MDCLIRIGGSVVGELVKLTVAPIGRPLGYLFYYERNMSNLEDQIQKLDHKMESFHDQVEEARRDGQKTYKTFQTWLSELGRRSKDAKCILDDEGRNKAKCTCRGPFPNLLTRYKLSRRACKMAETIVKELRKEETTFEEKFCRPILRSSFKNRNFQAFNSTEKTLGEIKEALKNANLSKIGVYGMGGIGKTTIVKEVARQVQEEGLFSEVIMVTVSQSFELKNIQERVAEQLGLTELKGSESEIAKKLKHRLKDEKKILLIFDDIWKKVDLEEAGISFREDQSGCKMIFVSRDRDILRQDMGVQKEIAVGVLSRNEAMDLFVKFVGDLNEKPADFKDVAVEIVAECGDLPISIVTIAPALKNKDIADWRNAKRKLKDYSPDEEINKPVYISIKMSYDDVVEREGRLRKSVLLLCALHGEDENISVEELVRYSVGWDLFGFLETWEAARDSMHSAVGRLKARCLLLDGDYCGTVKMHDVIRDVARSIAAKDENMHSITEVAKFEWHLKKGKPEDSIAITLHGLDFSRLLERFERLKCFGLELLLIFDNTRTADDSEPTPNGNECFEEMKELKVLRWESTKCPEPLLSSISSLQKLQMLSLPYCELEDIALIGELKNLIILDLSSSTVEQLPNQIGKLTNLRQLNLKKCGRLKVIQHDVISNLVQLEELYMDGVHGVKWKIEGVDDGESSYNASLIELKNLQRLKALHLLIVDRRALPKDMDFIENLERYHITIGSCWASVKIDTSRFLKLAALHERSDLLYKPGFQTLMKKCQDLYLGKDLLGFNNIAYQLDVNGFPQLKHLEVTRNDEVQNIVESTGEIQPCTAFENLETLILQNLSNLENICCGRFRAEPFSQLRTIRVRDCDKLKRVFSVSNIISGKLENITITDCRMMEEIFYDRTEDGTHNIGARRDEATNIDTSIEFRNIRSLTLDQLPNLVQFFRSEFYSSPNSPIPLFNEKVALPDLEELRLFNLDSVKTLWSDRLPKVSSMQNLKTLCVRNCNSLKYLFSVAMARSFDQLKELEVKNCKNMEEVLVIKESGQERRPKEIILFPQLETLELYGLPNFRRFYGGDFLIKCPSLRDLSIGNCTEELEGTKEPFFNEMVAFPVLEKLELSDLQSVQTLWPNRLPEVWSIHKIKKLSVSGCESLKYLFSVAMARSFVQLKELKVRRCEIMEEVLVIKEPGQERRPKKIILFPQLETLELYGLPNFRRFYGGDFLIKCPSLRDLNIKCCSEELEETEEPFFNEMVAFPVLEKLELSDLQSVQTLWPNRLPEVWSIQKIKKLSVSGCESLKYLFSVAMARSFVQLKELKVRRCEIMEEVLVIKEPGQERRPKEIILFPQLETLELYGLPNFRRFYGGDFLIKCPSLRDLNIKCCSEELEETEEPFFNEMVAFPRLEKLTVITCESLKYLLSYGMARSLLQLQSLTIKDCRHMEVVVVIKESFKDGRLENISFSKLEYVQLDSLPGLKRFSSVDCIECPSLKELSINGSHELGTYTASSTTAVPIIKDEREVEKRKLVLFSNSSKHFQLFRTSFKSLVSLEIKDCNNLVCSLPLDTVESLAQLKKLYVRSCKATEELIVVTKEDREEGSFKKISLPKLESLVLKDLPRLKRFCVAYCIECPSLLKLCIHGCPELRTFIANSALTPTQTTIKEEIRERDLGGQQLTLNETVVFPNLEELKLFHTGTEILNEIWPSLSSAVPFPKLKVLRLRCSEDRNWGVFLFDIHKYRYLRKIDLGGFSYMENLRQHPELGAVEEYSGRTLTRLTKLRLDRLPMLKHLFEDPEDFRTFQNLEILRLKSCGRLKTLVISSFVYFQNLRELRISKCDGMINLLASSVAKCLVQLNTMIISECDQMTEIIAEKEDEAESEIAFTKLKTLGLHRLPTLKSFYCGNSKIRFPKLKKVIVSKCPQMVNFSRGTVITSNLERVIAKKERTAEYPKVIEEVWEGDLNASVRMIWENDLYTAVQNLFSETDDKSSKERTAVHQDVEKLKEDIASSSSSK